MREYSNHPAPPLLLSARHTCAEFVYGANSLTHTPHPSLVRYCACRVPWALTYFFVAHACWVILFHCKVSCVVWPNLAFMLHAFGARQAVALVR